MEKHFREEITCPAPCTGSLVAVHGEQPPKAPSKPRGAHSTAHNSPEESHTPAKISATALRVLKAPKAASDKSRRGELIMLVGDGTVCWSYFRQLDDLSILRGSRAYTAYTCNQAHSCRSRAYMAYTCSQTHSYQEIPFPPRRSRGTALLARWWAEIHRHTAMKSPRRAFL